MKARNARELLASFDHCHAEVRRSGELQPCGKPATAVVDDPMGYWWAVCNYHGRARPLVPVPELVKAVGR